MSAIRVNQVYGTPDPESWFRVRNIYRDKSGDQITTEGFNYGCRFESIETFQKRLERMQYVLIFDPHVSITGEEPPPTSSKEKDADRLSEDRYYAEDGKTWLTKKDFWNNVPAPDRSKWYYIARGTLLELIPGQIAARKVSNERWNKKQTATAKTSPLR